MGYLAILARDADKAHAKDLRVKRLHINMWALRGLWFGRRLFHFDVGIELSLEDPALPDDISINAVEVLLPFRVEEGKWPGGAPVAQDLFAAVTDDHSGPLIFGSPVQVLGSLEGRAKIKFENNELTVLRVAEGEVKAVDGHAQKADSSLYTVPLRHPITKGQSAYFRLRWRVFGAAPMWRWARQESGARVDFRVCDTRQGVPSERNPAFLNRVLEIETANVFVMAPGRLRPTNVSPAPKHIRTLEPNAWAEYLKGAAAWRWMARDLLVYGWHRRLEDGRITEDSPMRVFLSLNKPAGTPWWLNVGYSAAGFALVWSLLALSGPVSALSFDDLNTSTVLSLVGIGSFMALWNAVQRARSFWTDRFRWPRRQLRAIERFLICR